MKTGMARSEVAEKFQLLKTVLKVCIMNKRRNWL